MCAGPEVGSFVMDEYDSDEDEDNSSTDVAGEEAVLFSGLSHDQALRRLSKLTTDDVKPSQKVPTNGRRASAVVPGLEFGGSSSNDKDTRATNSVVQRRRTRLLAESNSAAARGKAKTKTKGKGKRQSIGARNSIGGVIEDYSDGFFGAEEPGASFSGSIQERDEFSYGSGGSSLSATRSGLSINGVYGGGEYVNPLAAAHAQPKEKLRKKRQSTAAFMVDQSQISAAEIQQAVADTRRRIQKATIVEVAAALATAEEEQRSEIEEAVRVARAAGETDVEWEVQETVRKAVRELADVSTQRAEAQAAAEATRAELQQARDEVMHMENQQKNASSADSYADYNWEWGDIPPLQPQLLNVWKAKVQENERAIEAFKDELTQEFEVDRETFWAHHMALIKQLPERMAARHQQRMERAVREAIEAYEKERKEREREEKERRKKRKNSKVELHRYGTGYGEVEWLR